MIKQTVSAYDVIELARVTDRMSHFGYDGWHALFEYRENLSEETGEDIELDIVAWCCDFKKFEDIADYNAQYGTEYESADDVEEVACVIDSGPAFICRAH